jgi:hypothetical protein
MPRLLAAVSASAKIWVDRKSPCLHALLCATQIPTRANEMTGWQNVNVLSRESEEIQKPRGGLYLEVGVRRVASA